MVISPLGLKKSPATASLRENSTAPCRNIPGQSDKKRIISKIPHPFCHFFEKARLSKNILNVINLLTIVIPNHLNIPPELSNFCLNHPLDLVPALGHKEQSFLVGALQGAPVLDQLSQLAGVGDDHISPAS
jgi:hypothetical protein